MASSRPVVSSDRAVIWSLEPPETPLGKRPGPFKGTVYRDPLFDMLDESFLHVVEIGASHGAWGWRMLTHCKHVLSYVAIDPYVEHRSEGGHRQRWMADNKRRWLANLAPWGGKIVRGPVRFSRSRRAELIVGRSEDVADLIEPAIDLLFVDGDHRAPHVLRDLEVYSPKVRSGGIVVLDDLTLRLKPPQPGVAEALKDYFERGVRVPATWDEGAWTNNHECAMWRVP